MIITCSAWLKMYDVICESLRQILLSNRDSTSIKELVWFELTSLCLSPYWLLRVAWIVPYAWPFNALNKNAPDVGGTIRTNPKAVSCALSATVQLSRIIHPISVMNVRKCHVSGWSSWIPDIAPNTGWAWSATWPRLKIKAWTRSWFIKLINIPVVHAGACFVFIVPAVLCVIHKFPSFFDIHSRSVSK